MEHKNSGIRPRCNGSLSVETSPEIAHRPPPIVFCYILFFLSGTAALIYQVSWSRQIGLLFGHTVHAAAVVLGSYFAGMAVGHLLGARWSSRVSALVAYAIAELTVAVWACVIPLLLNWAEALTIVTWLSSSSFAWQTTVRALFSFLLLLPATTALGVTLPMMAELVSGRRNCGGADPTDASRVSSAYACNTAGAMTGVLSATFFLLVVVGVRTSSYVAAGISTVCAIAAFMLVRIQPLRSQAHRIDRTEKADGQKKAHSRTLGDTSKTSCFWIGLAGLSGFGTLALEVLYTRMFSLVLHNSTYTFGSVVVVFLAALSLGAALASWLQRRIEIDSLAGWATGLGALATMLSVPVFIALTDLEYYSYGESFFQYLGGALLLVVLVVAPPITLLGMQLPIAWQAVSRDVVAGQVVGRLTAVNTIAAAVGALATSFLFLPWIGLWGSFVLLGLVLSLVPFASLLRSGRRRAACGGAALVAALTVLALRSPLEARYGQTKLGEKLVRRWNSPYGWIDVVQVEKTGSFKVRQNLHYRFGETRNNAREFRQAHIPLLLHPQPRDVLFLGLGTGLTAGGAIPHREVAKIVAVELIPEVVEAARMLADYNYGVADHPKVQIRVDDARHYLLVTDRRFDVIVSDLFVPWESETGYLYTVEHYRVARSRMKAGGLFCQWLPLYQLGKREFEIIADSFASVFPVTTIWWGQIDPARPVIALIGSDGFVEVDAERLAVRLASLRRMAQSSDDNPGTPESVYNAYQGDWLRRHSSRLNTDEHPRVEFLTPTSNRDHRMLRGPVLREYYDNALTGLPSHGVRWWSAGRLVTPSVLQQNRAWRRFILFGER